MRQTAKSTARFTKLPLTILTNLVVLAELDGSLSLFNSAPGHVCLQALMVPVSIAAAIGGKLLPGSQPFFQTPAERVAPALVIIGASSRAGLSIEKHWPGGEVVRIHRGQGPGMNVADYARVPEGVIPAGSVVVNCVGTPTGSEAKLTRINRDIALSWAKAARDASACSFIQLSSFSVYGKTETVGPGTREVPHSAYGRSKLAADRALLALGRHGLSVTLVRTPMLFGDGSDKLERLVAAVLRSGLIPSLARPIKRSMLSYAALGAAIAHLGQHPTRGVVNVADPTVFTYELLEDRAHHVGGRELRRVPVPQYAAAMIRLIFPVIHARLLSSSVLEPSAALRFELPPDASLQEAIDRLIRSHQ